MFRRDDRARRNGQSAGPPSVPEIGRALRRERTRQGLRIQDVAAAAGLPVPEIEALESGAPDRVPDRIHILKTLRRYAGFLGLPGDDLLLAMVESWPAVVPVVGRPGGQGADTGVLHPQGPTLDTGPVTVVPGPTAADPDTGVVPVQAQPQGGRGPVSEPPVALRALVVTLSLAVVVGVGALVVNQVHPRWLHDMGIDNQPRSAGVGLHAAGPLPAGPGGGGGGGAPTSVPQTAQVAPERSKGRTTPPAGRHAPVFRVLSSSPAAATFRVGAPTYTVEVVPTGGRCWVQVTGPQRPAPLFSGVLGDGATKSFTARKELTIEVGARSGRVFVSVGGKLVGFYFPTAAPFTMTFLPEPTSS